MGKLGMIKSFFSFIAGGFVAIVVGCFMLRGTMHLWDNDSKITDKKKLKQTDD